ncbi:cupin domain-containing protein [Trichocoleus desertorum AS-A10]|uniref:cupin domain-containing protein n=1 Tax=Trichocoleus desertorum TaxID=1481672 RepID=UPI0032980EF9
MAILQLSNGKVCGNSSEIVRELALFNVQLQHYSLEAPQHWADLLAEDVLPDLEKRQILELCDRQLGSLKQETSYLWSDLLVFHPGSSQLHSISTYNRYHTHKAPEALYILSGEAIFSFIELDGQQVQLLVQPGDYVQIAAGVEHWFSPTASLEFKAVRYFTTVDGWVPQYTELGELKKLR